MAVSISRDLSVMVEDTSVRKLTDRQEALKESIQKGEPKVLGVSQVMVGVVVISYSLPLLASDFTEVVNFGVPWWSGTVFILAGAVAIATDKHSNMKFLCACLITTAIGLLVSILAVIFYFVDLHKNPDITPSKDCNPETDHCNIEHFVVAFSRGVKSSLLLFTIVQAIIASILSYNLYRERKRFNDYTALNQLIPPSPTGATPIEFN
ncbi:transmembrane protein 176 [Anguilla anguilla]|nr:transmembrane protein 176 [Anguilla anguilla]XP_035274123.1 transmembrane protein 176 [Anguilla anguilla]